LIDQSDPLDTSLKFAYTKYAPNINITETDLYPTNEGEISTLYVKMNSS